LGSAHEVPGADGVLGLRVSDIVEAPVSMACSVRKGRRLDHPPLTFDLSQDAGGL